MRFPEHGDGDRDQPEVGGDVEEEDDVAVELGDGGLAVVPGVGVDLPVALEGVAAEEDGEKDDKVCGSDEAPADFDAQLQMGDLMRHSSVACIHADLEKPEDQCV